MVDSARDRIGDEVGDAADRGTDLVGGRDPLGEAGDAFGGAGDDLRGGADAALDRAGDAAGGDAGGGIIDKIKDLIGGGDESGER